MLIPRLPSFERKLVIASACVLGLGLAGCGERAQMPPETQMPSPFSTYGIEDFLATTNFFGNAFSPDGTKLLVSSDQTGVPNAYALPVGGGEAVPLTSSGDDSVRVVDYFPQDERILFYQDRGGDELNHLYVRELTGEIVDLTPGEGLRAQFMGWSRDGTGFYVTTNEREPTHSDVYRYSTLRGEDGSYPRRMLLRIDDDVAAALVAPDEAAVALTRVRSREESDILLRNVTTGETRVLASGAAPGANSNADVENTGSTTATYTPAAFHPDGSRLYFTSDRDSEFRYLASLDLRSGAATQAEAEMLLRTDWDISSVRLSRDGSHLATTINRDSRFELRLFRTGGFTEIPLPELDGLELYAPRLSRDNRQLAFYARSGKVPGDLYIHDLAKGGEPRRLTSSLNPSIDVDHLVAGEVVRFESFDGLEIPGILYKPHTASADNPAPALVWVHGGPGGQSRVGYEVLTQYLVNHGYAIYAINNRGSGGYGRTFSRLDDRRHGSDDLGDCVASKAMLAELGWVDAERIGIFGGSYGGYMVLAALAFQPEEFQVGVDLFGVANWLRTLRSIPPWWTVGREALYAELGNPNMAEDEAHLRRISPLFHTESIARPLMVLQGANDPRVLQVESDEIVEAVRGNGVPVEYLVFDDEGHGFRNKKNQETGYRAILEFLDRQLKTAPPA